MAKEYKIGRIFGLRLSIEPFFFIGTIVLWIVFGGISAWLLDLPLGQAVVWGLVATLLYWVSDIIHHLGHAYAARQMGYPMTGIRLGTFLVLGTSFYPDDEGELSGTIHIRRALGGPTASLLFTFTTGILAVLLYPIGGAVWGMVVFLSLINLLVYTVGAFLPLGFTDGSTILKWWGKRES